MKNKVEKKKENYFHEIFVAAWIFLVAVFYGKFLVAPKPQLSSFQAETRVREVFVIQNPVPRLQKSFLNDRFDYQYTHPHSMSNLIEKKNQSQLQLHQPEQTVGQPSQFHTQNYSLSATNPGAPHQKYTSILGVGFEPSIVPGISEFPPASVQGPGQAETPNEAHFRDVGTTKSHTLRISAGTEGILNFNENRQIEKRNVSTQTVLPATRDRSVQTSPLFSRRELATFRQLCQSLKESKEAQCDFRTLEDSVLNTGRFFLLNLVDEIQRAHPDSNLISLSFTTPGTFDFQNNSGISGSIQQFPHESRAISNTKLNRMLQGTSLNSGLVKLTIHSFHDIYTSLQSGDRAQNDLMTKLDSYISAINGVLDKVESSSILSSSPEVQEFSAETSSSSSAQLVEAVDLGESRQTTADPKFRLVTVARISYKNSKFPLEANCSFSLKRKNFSLGVGKSWYYPIHSRVGVLVAVDVGWRLNYHLQNTHAGGLPEIRGFVGLGSEIL